MKSEEFEIYEAGDISVSCLQSLVENFTILNEKLVRITKLIADGEGCKIGSISIIIGDDNMLAKLNMKWLKINSPTDVLAFNLSDGVNGCLEGDIYISMDRVRKQAEEYGVTSETELLRLAAHGMLHLCGMDDDDDISLRRMSDRGENYVLMVQ